LPDFSEQQWSGTGSTYLREQFEELLGRNSSGSRSRNEVTIGGTRCADHVTPSIR
jgi:hypothetical protein